MNTFTLEQHRVLGAALKSARDAVHRELCDGQLKKTSRRYRQLKKLKKRIEDARCTLDDFLMADHTDGEFCNAYYGPQK